MKSLRIKLLFVMLLQVISLMTGCNPMEQREPLNEGLNNSKVQDQPLKFTMSMSNMNNYYAINSSDLEKDKWIQELNKRANIELKLRLFNHGSIAEQMSLMFASGDIPDVVYSLGDWRAAELAGAVEAGLFMPLDDLIEKNKASLGNLFKSIPSKAWEESKTYFDGKIYGIPVGYLSNPSLNGTYIRKDLLDKYSLKVPKSLDEFVEVMRVFKENGMQYPYVGREKWTFTTTFFEAFGVAVNRWNFNSSGDLVPDILRPEMKEALIFHAQLREEGLMDPETLTTTGLQWGNKIRSGKSGAIFTHQAAAIPEWNARLKENIPEGEFDLIPAPVGPKGSSGSNISPTVFSTVYLNKRFTEPEKFLEFLDWCASEKGQEFFNFGLEGKDYKKEQGKIAYTPPSDSYSIYENSFRRMMGLVNDASYNKAMLPFVRDGDRILNFYNNISPKEGYHAFKIETLDSFKNYPDLKPDNSKLFQEYAAKIFLGKIPAEDYDKFIEEYMRRGGDKVIKEVNELYKKGQVPKY